MPSPIAHAVSGYAISRAWPERKTTLAIKNNDRETKRSIILGAESWLTAYVIFVSVAADLDFVPQILTGDRYHHGPTHSIAFAIGTAIIAWLASRPFSTRKKAVQLGLLTLALYGSHLMLDLVTQGGDGIQLLWPFNQNYYQSPWLLFPSTGWSKGWFDPQHFIFLAFELGYSSLVLVGLSQLKSRKRKPLPNIK